MYKQQFHKAPFAILTLHIFVCLYWHIHEHFNSLGGIRRHYLNQTNFQSNLRSISTTNVFVNLYTRLLLNKYYYLESRWLDTFCVLFFFFLSFFFTNLSILNGINLSPPSYSTSHFVNNLSFKGFCIQAFLGWALFPLCINNNNIYYICTSPVTVTMTYWDMLRSIAKFHLYICVSTWYLVCNISLHGSN